MRVILSINSGPMAGDKRLLGPQRELDVGRSEWAQWVCAHDQKMSRVHFKLETNAYGCSVTDAGSSNGTFVNEEKIEAKVVLRNGDRIRAGGTVFEVEIEGGSTEEAETLNQVALAELAAREEARASAIELRTREAILGGETNVFYRAEQVPSGLTAFVPARPEPRVDLEAARVAGLLWQELPTFVMVHPLKTEELSADDFSAGEPVLDYMPEEVARERSPLLIPPDALDDLTDTFEKAWGHNALVTLAAESTFEEMLERLRVAVRGGGNDGGLLGLCWPGVLDGLLCEGDRRLFDEGLHLKAAFLEDAKHENRWKLIADADFAETLQRIGLAEEGKAKEADR